MKKLLLCLAVLISSTVVVHAASPWSVRLRATYLQTIDESDAFSALGINFPKNAIKVSDKFIPEIDVAYAFTETLSAELVLTVPQEHTVSLAGVGRLGDFKHLPPTLFFQYRARPGKTFRPYVGAGVNFTFIFDDNLTVAGNKIALDNYSVNVAAQAGFDYRINDTWALNADVKKALIRTDVSIGGTAITEARLDPWLYSLGVRYEF